MSASITSAILNATDQHNQLLQTLDLLETIPDQLEQQNELIQALNASLGRTEENTTRLRHETARLKKIHQKTRESKGRKFAYSMVGRTDQFLEMTLKRERAYTEALEQEIREENRREELLVTISAALDKQTTLLKKQEEYAALTEKLDSLHGSIFDGSPDFPEADTLNKHLESASGTISRLQKQLETGLHSETTLRTVLLRLDRALDLLSTAILIATERESAFGDRKYSPDEEDTFAEEAQNLAKAAECSCLQLPALHTKDTADSRSSLVTVPTLGHAGLRDKGKLVNLESQVRRSREKVIERITYTHHYCKVAKTDLLEAKEVSQNTLRQLRMVRRDIFQRVVAAAPPAYSPTQMSTP